MYCSGVGMSIPIGWYYDVFLRQRSLYTENDKMKNRGGRRRKALGPSLLLVAVIGTALMYLWLAGNVTKAKLDRFTKAKDRGRTRRCTRRPQPCRAVALRTHLGRSRRRRGGRL